MKIFLKKLFESIGIRMNLVKNLWYLDSFFILKNLSQNPNPVIFDIGACDGSSVYDFKRKFPNSKIYSFEPFPPSYDNLEKISKNFSDVFPFQIAFSDHNGDVDFFVNASKGTNSLLKPTITHSFIDIHARPEGSMKVLSMTLDTFLHNHTDIDYIDILKLDVQGAELRIFKGANELLLSKRVKIIYTEVWFLMGYENQPLYSDIADFLKSYGYYPFGIYNLHYRQDGHFLWGDAIFYIK